MKFLDKLDFASKYHYAIDTLKSQIDSGVFSHSILMTCIAESESLTDHEDNVDAFSTYVDQYLKVLTETYNEDRRLCFVVNDDGGSITHFFNWDDTSLTLKLDDDIVIFDANTRSIGNLDQSTLDMFKLAIQNVADNVAVNTCFKETLTSVINESGQIRTDAKSALTALQTKISNMKSAPAASLYQSISTAYSEKGFKGVLSYMYDRCEEISTTEDTEIGYNSVIWDIKAFFGQQIVMGIITTITTLMSVVILAFSKIAGALLSILGTLFGSLFSWISDANDTKMKFNDKGKYSYFSIPVYDEELTLYLPEDRTKILQVLNYVAILFDVSIDAIVNKQDFSLLCKELEMDQVAGRICWNCEVADNGWSFRLRAFARVNIDTAQNNSMTRPTVHMKRQGVPGMTGLSNIRLVGQRGGTLQFPEYKLLQSGTTSIVLNDTVRDLYQDIKVAYEYGSTEYVDSIYSDQYNANTTSIQIGQSGGGLFTQSWPIYDLALFQSVGFNGSILLRRILANTTPTEDGFTANENELDTVQGKLALFMERAYDLAYLANGKDDRNFWSVGRAIQTLNDPYQQLRDILVNFFDKDSTGAVNSILFCVANDDRGLGNMISIEGQLHDLALINKHSTFSPSDNPGGLIDNSWDPYYVGYLSSDMLYNDLLSESMFNPPIATMRTINNSWLITFGVTLATAALSAAAYTISRKWKNMMAKRLNALEAAKYNWQDNQTAENWNDYRKKVRNYNLLAWVSGYDKVNYMDGYTVTDTDGSSFDTIDSIVSSGDDSNIQRIINLINPNSSAESNE